jgi:imidazoleglycerol-phosphate dehydratase
MMRKATVKRNTKETDIAVTVNLDGGKCLIDIPSGFLTHMLDSFARHSGMGLTVKAQGDIQVDMHHTVEDIGIVLGQAIREALGNKKGINRYGFAKLPMDEALVEVALDLSGRPYFMIHGEEDFFGQVGDIELDLIPEFMKALAFNAGITMHLSVISSGNAHHLAECCFKAFARAIRDAAAITGEDVPSTKEVL